MDRHKRNTFSGSARIGAAGQRGLSMYGWVLALLIGAALLTATLRLGPHYIDFRIVQGVADRLPVDDVHTMPKAKIKEHFSKQFRIENFRIPVNDMMKIERDREKTVLAIDYEVREHMVYNVDVVLSFSEQRTYK